MAGRGLSRRRAIQAGAVAAFGAFLLPRLASCTKDTTESIFQFDLTGEPARPYKLGALESAYVPMRDGARIALDIVRPADDDVATKRDTILVMTRYWRGEKGAPATGWADRSMENGADGGAFVSHGYALVIGDVRGTGASFGQWPHHRARAETLDYGEVIDWIAAQPWSTGRVVGYGLSYTANTADWMAERNNPALKGIIPRHADYDPYEDVYFPGGIPNTSYGQSYGERVKEYDRNRDPSSDTSPGVRPAGPNGEADLAAALRDHEPVPPVSDGFREVTFKDDRPASWNGDSMLDWSIMEVADRVSKSGTPIQNWAGWWDGATAQGAARRFLRQSNSLNIIIGPWGHGAPEAYDPLLADPKSVRPATPGLEANDIRFADDCFNGQAAREHGKTIHYYTLGEGWKSTTSWPVSATRQRWYIAAESRLSTSPEQTGVDSLQVDRALGDSFSRRWEYTGDVDWVSADRRQFDAARLAYTSDPLTHDTEITGHPVVHLNITSTREDGNFFVYLEPGSTGGGLGFVLVGAVSWWGRCPLAWDDCSCERDNGPKVRGHLLDASIA